MVEGMISKLIGKLTSKQAFILILLAALGVGGWWYYKGQEEKFPIPEGQYVLVENKDYSDKTTAGKFIAEGWDVLKKQLTLGHNITVNGKELSSPAIGNDKRLPIHVDPSGQCYIELDVLGNRKTVTLNYSTDEKMLTRNFPNKTLLYKKGN